MGSFGKRTTERSLKTLVEALLALWLADGGLDIINVTPEAAVGTSVVAAALSVVASLLSKKTGLADSPSLVG